MQYSPIVVASLLFLPHGIRSIMIVLSGAKAFLPLFFAHLITDLSLGLTLAGGLKSGIAIVPVMALPLVLINFLSNKAPFEPLAHGNTANLSLFRLVIVVGAVSSLLNGIIGAYRYQKNPDALVAFKYFTGDMLGVVLVLGILLALKKPLLALGRKLV